MLLFFCFASVFVKAQDISIAADNDNVINNRQIPSQPDSGGIVQKAVQLAQSMHEKARNYYEIRQRNMFILPMVSWNNYDRWYQGICVFSNPVAKKRLNYTFCPSWSFSTSSFLISGKISYLALGNETGRYINPEFSFRSYSYDRATGLSPDYLSLHPGTEFFFGYGDSVRTGINVKLKYHHVFQKHLVWNPTLGLYQAEDRSYNVFQVLVKTHLLRFADENKQTLNLEMNRVMGKISLTEEHVFRMVNPKKRLYFRLFAGAFLYSQLPSDIDYRFRLSGVNGSDDYMYELPFFGRSEPDFNMLSGQMYPFDGYFKTPTPLGQTWNWLIAVNLRADLPGILPVQFYFDAGTYSDAKVIVPSSSGIPWNAGLVVTIRKDIAEIYIPLFFSNDIRDVFELNNVNFLRRITWMVRFDKLSITELLKKK